MPKKCRACNGNELKMNKENGETNWDITEGAERSHIGRNAPSF